MTPRDSNRSSQRQRQVRQEVQPIIGLRLSLRPWRVPLRTLRLNALDFVFPAVEEKNLLRPLHQCARDHVVQSLFTLGESRHDVPNKQNHPRDEFRKVPSGSAGK